MKAWITHQFLSLQKSNKVEKLMKDIHLFIKSNRKLEAKGEEVNWSFKTR